MKKDYAKECAVLKDYMDAMIDELRSACGNDESIFDSTLADINEAFKENGNAHILMQPALEKTEMKQMIESSVESDVRKGILCEDIKEFTEAIYDEMRVLYGEQNADYIAEEAKKLVNSYNNGYDENDYVDVHPDVILARRSRIVDEFELLSNSEIEKEYLFMYNSYTSALRYNSLFENELVSLTSEEAVCNVVSTTASKYSRKMEEENTAHLLQWNPKSVHDLKERFLDLIPQMDKEKAKICYMEMSDIWLTTMQLNEMLIDDCRDTEEIGNNAVERVLKSINDKIKKDYTRGNMTDKEIENSLSDNEKEILSDLFGM